MINAVAGYRDHYNQHQTSNWISHKLLINTNTLVMATPTASLLPVLLGKMGCSVKCAGFVHFPSLQIFVLWGKKSCNYLQLFLETENAERRVRSPLGREGARGVAWCDTNHKVGITISQYQQFWWHNDHPHHLDERLRSDNWVPWTAMQWQQLWDRSCTVHYSTIQNNTLKYNTVQCSAI